MSIRMTVIIVVVWCLVFPQLLLAGGGESTELVFDSNTGFLKDVPKELREELPMCDEFLDVHWIREMPGGYWVGRVVVDVYNGEKKEQRELVVLEKDRSPGSFLIFDVTTSNYRGRQLEALIMSADIVNVARDRDYRGGEDCVA